MAGLKKLDQIAEGQLVPMAFLKVDVVGHSAIALTNPTRSVQDTFDAVEDLVARHVEERYGQIWTWMGDGGLAVFCSDDLTEMCEAAVQCGLGVLDELPQFNAEIRSVRDEIQMRLAAHVGIARIRDRRGSIHSPAINFVSHLESSKEHTPPNTLSISQDVHRELSGSDLAVFGPSGAFEGLGVYNTRQRLPTPAREPVAVSREGGLLNLQCLGSVSLSVQPDALYPGAILAVRLFGRGLAMAKQVDLTIAVNPPDAFDLAEAAFEGPTGLISLPVSLQEDGSLRGAAADFLTGGLLGDQTLGVFSIQALPQLSAYQEVEVRVLRVSVGPSSTERSEATEDMLQLSTSLPILRHGEA